MRYGELIHDIESTGVSRDEIACVSYVLDIEDKRIQKDPDGAWGYFSYCELEDGTTHRVVAVELPDGNTRIISENLNGWYELSQFLVDYMEFQMLEINKGGYPIKYVKKEEYPEFPDDPNFLLKGLRYWKSKMTDLLVGKLYEI